MKSMIVVALALLAVAAAAPAEKEPTKIIRSDFVQQPDSSYNFVYETDDGTRREETGELKQVVDEDNKPHDVVVVRGLFTFINPDGQPETIEYEADENGFRAKGTSIPEAKAASRR